MSLMRVLLVLIAVTVSTNAYCSKDYPQKIVLHVTKTTSDVVSHPPRICFSTTDLFDLSHCNSLASKSYLHGPKRWHLNVFSSARVNYGINCKKLSGTTPPQEGRLDIYITTASRTQTDALAPVHHILELVNCSTTWTPLNV